MLSIEQIIALSNQGMSADSIKAIDNIVFGNTNPAQLPTPTQPVQPVQPVQQTATGQKYDPANPANSVKEAEDSYKHVQNLIKPMHQQKLVS